MRTSLLLCLAAIATAGALLRGSWHRSQADFWRTTARLRSDAERAATAPPPAGDPTRTIAEHLRTGDQVIVWAHPTRSYLASVRDPGEHWMRGTIERLALDLEHTFLPLTITFTDDRTVYAQPTAIAYRLDANREALPSWLTP